MSVFQGSCHCGRVTFEVETALDAPIKCNCSLCRRKGALMHRVPKANFKLLNGSEALRCYQWNTHKAKHYFCGTCGIYTHHQPRTAPDMFGFNVGCLDGVDPESLEFTWVNGAGLSLEG